MYSSTHANGRAMHVTLPSRHSFSLDRFIAISSRGAWRNSVPAHEPVPNIEVSEEDGVFSVYADFSNVPQANAITIEFSRQGLHLFAGAFQRYVPIPTDSDIELATVRVDNRIARIMVPSRERRQRRQTLVTR